MASSAPFQFARVSYLHGSHGHADCWGRGLGLSKSGCHAHIVRIPNYRYGAQWFGKHLFEQLQPLCPQLRGHHGQARNVSARVSKACDESVPHWIRTEWRDDRNRASPAWPPLPMAKSRRRSHPPLAEQAPQPARGSARAFLLPSEPPVADFCLLHSQVREALAGSLPRRATNYFAGPQAADSRFERSSPAAVD
jgi:hypothetical protein